jgi:outer membrane protein
MIDVLKKIKLNFFKMWLIMLWCFLALSPNLNADTLDEVLRLTFSTNKQLLLSRTQLQSSKTAIDISKSALGLNFAASINGSRGWNINESSKSDSYSSSLTGSYNISDGNLSKSKVLIDEALYKIAKLQLRELEQKVLLDTINSYLNVLRDQKFVELSNNNVAVLERQFLEIRDRFQLGEVTNKK